MTTESKKLQTILDEALAQIPSLKRNKDHRVNGSALHGLEMKTRRAMEREGATLNEAYHLVAPAFRDAAAAPFLED